MNFNVYIRKESGRKITKISKTLHRSRNSIINEAIEEWLKKHSPSEWPPQFFDFSPIKNSPDFKKFRNEFKDNVLEDPLA